LFVPKPLLCVTVTAATTADLRRQRDHAADADLVELRLDGVEDPDVGGALAGRRTPVVVTCRPRWEGGAFDGAEEERKRILSDAIRLGADYVDVEWRAGFDDLIAARRGRGIVLSSHEFDGIPSDLARRVEAMRATGAEVVKIAVTAKRLADCAAVGALSAHADGRVIAIAMGEHGVPTRVLAGRLGAPWTYAGALRDVGQISAHEMIRDYRFRDIDAETQLYGIVGASVRHSVSPAMHNTAFRALRLNAVYLPFPSVDADDFVAFGRAFGVAGASVTIPHKVSLFERLDEVYAAARRIGAVNTIRVEDGRWIGDNTDASGFLQPLQERIRVSGLRASVLGAGGSARAVADALGSCDCTVRVHARQRARAEQVAAATRAAVGPWPPEPGSWDVLINCTPVGQAPRVDETPIPKAQLTGRCVYDLVYNPTPTRLLREAADMGCQTIGGLEMLVAQGAEQFRWWTGVRPPVGIMREAALKRLAEFARNENHVV
jgi:shikimate dehydrogenase/3-dehydroquinate dehydratase type I